MVTGIQKKIKIVCGWVMFGLVIWNAVGVPLILASEEVIDLSPIPESSTSPLTIPDETTSQSEEISPVDLGVVTSPAVSEAVAVTEANTNIVGDGQITVVVTSPEASSSALVLGEYLDENEPQATDSAKVEQSPELNQIDINNAASVSSQVTADARSGEIRQEGEDNTSTSVVTGDASALAVNIALVNTTLINSDLWVGVVDIQEAWNGDIYIPMSDPEIEEISNKIKLKIDNNGNIVTTTIAEADTGEVSQSEGGVVETGDAIAVASNIVLADVTLVDTEVTAIFVDNLWMWSGLIYNLREPGSVDSPQQVWLSQGRQAEEECNKTMSCSSEITIKNQADVEIDTIAKADTGEVTQHTQGVALTQTGDATAIANTTALVNTTLLNSRLRLLSLLLAAPWRGNLIFVYPEEEVGPVPDPDPTPNSDDKGGVATVNHDQGAVTETPILKLSATHNAEHGIYPGDGVTYDVVVYNDGPIAAQNVMLKQEFMGTDGSIISTMQAKVGEIGVSKRRMVHFVLKTGTGMKTGVYTTKTVAIGESDRGVKTESNLVAQEFKILIKSKLVLASEPVIVPPVEIVNVGDDILGISVSRECNQCLAMPWYIAIWLGSLLYYGVCFKRRDWGSVMRYGLALPLTSYAGLLYTNPTCRSGIEILHTNNPWCEWFLAISVGIYLINGLLVKVGKNISNTNVPAMIYFRS